MNFEYRNNPDGSFALFNTEIGDIYFSNIGAHKEAMEKFVIPSEPENFKNKKVKILDVCYGMGYNSKSFVDYCEKNNFNCEYEIDCIELDKNILALGLMIFDEQISDDINLYFGREILNQINLEDNFKNISGENWIKNISEVLRTKFEQFFSKNDINLYKNNVFNGFLHNIYYQNHDNFHIFAKKLKIFFILDDLLKILPQLNKKYDLIFHDAFSIRKQPEMWDEFVMSNYYRLLTNGGKLLTYSNSNVLKRLLINLDFDVQTNYDMMNKQNGTIAIKK